MNPSTTFSRGTKSAMPQAIPSPQPIQATFTSALSHTSSQSMHQQLPQAYFARQHETFNAFVPPVVVAPPSAGFLIDNAALFNRISFLECSFSSLQQQFLHMSEQLRIAHHRLDQIQGVNTQTLPVPANVTESQSTPLSSTTKASAMMKEVLDPELANANTQSKVGVSVSSRIKDTIEAPSDMATTLAATPIVESAYYDLQTRSSHAWENRMMESRLITKEDVACFKRASIPRAIFLAQVGFGEMPPIFEVFRKKSFAGRSKCKSTLYRIRNLLLVFNSVFQARFDYLDAFIALMDKDAVAETGSWCELGDFYSRDSARAALQKRVWPECSSDFVEEWNKFRQQRSGSRSRLSLVSKALISNDSK